LIKLVSEKRARFLTAAVGLLALVVVIAAPLLMLQSLSAASMSKGVKGQYGAGSKTTPS